MRAVARDVVLWRVPAHEWPPALRDAGLRTLHDNVLGLAAGLTYFTVITLFPALVAFVSFLVLIGQAHTVSSLLKVVADVGPTAGAGIVSVPVHHVISRGGSPGTLVFTAAFSFVAASGYVGTFAWMSRQLRGEPAPGSFWEQRVRQALVALAVLGLLGLIAVIIVLSPPLFVRAGSHFGHGGAGLLLYRVLRWPALFFAALVLFNLLHSLSSAPPGERRGWITGGSVVAIVSWLLATLVYDLYVRYVGHYASFYGLVGGLIAFLLWLWMLNIAVLGGVELNLQLDRHRQGRPETRAGDRATGKPSRRSKARAA